MNRKKASIQRLTLAAFFIAIEVVLAYTPIGYLPVGALSITTLHLPVILAGCLLGPAFGAEIGFVFGLTSFIRATMTPSITSFVFTPFFSVGGISGNFFSLIICFVPRILLGWSSGMMYRYLSKHLHRNTVSAMLTAVFNTALHTFLVLGGIWIFFGTSYASVLGISMEGLLAAFVATITTNGILEAALAGVSIPVLVRVLSPIIERMKINHGKNEMCTDRSNRGYSSL